MSDVFVNVFFHGFVHNFEKIIDNVDGFPQKDDFGLIFHLVSQVLLVLLKVMAILV